ncbi:HTH-type transcriptional activator RhaR [bioreactor metagenome]|uniref:HTH-type transcriptional activator RhaR n=1 Tax=bioreactor metagenome TaxID=1076179 RepID=A0A645BFA4_9ZZZZ
MTTYFSGIEFGPWGHYPEYYAPMKDHVTDFYGIQYNHSGPFSVQVNENDPVTVQGSYLFLTYPGVLYNYGPPKKGEARYHAYISFTGKRVKRYLETELLPSFDEKTPLIKITKSESFLSSLLQCQFMLSTSRNTVNPRMVLLLEDILLQIHEQPKLSFNISPFCEKQLIVLMGQINERPQADWDFSREAARLSISLSHFRRIFKILSGYSPLAYLIQCRIKMAEALLIKTVMPLREVARQCGFEDVFYFSRIFKQHKFITPIKFRKENR